jgi:dihydrofolate reductase
MINIIVAASITTKIIGNKDKLPWSLPNDMAYFKEKTTGAAVIMGRKTYESIGKPLPNRLNIVLSNNSKFKADGVIVASSLESAIDLAKEHGEVFIIGGSTIYYEAVDLADRLYITWVMDSGECVGDSYFPMLSPSDWVNVGTRECEPDSKNKYKHSFCVYDRVKK